MNHFSSHGKSPWDYIDRKVSFKEVGINSTNFFKELAPLIPETKCDHWSNEEWWGHVYSRIYYFFHKASDKGDRANGKPRPRCWAEWPGPIPPRPEEAQESEAMPSDGIAFEVEGRRTTAVILREKWDQLRFRMLRVTERFRISA